MRQGKYREFFSIRRIRFFLAAIIFCLISLSFLGYPNFDFLINLQWAPALLTSVLSFSSGAICILIGICLSTFFFGRFYCSILCPFGFFQEIISLFISRKSNRVVDLKLLRYGILGGVLGALFFGSVSGFLWLDPYSNFGRMIGSFSLGGVAVFVVIFLMVFLKNRLFCVSLCPVGTFLGLISKLSFFRLAILGKCVKCGRCAKVCPTDCIDIENGEIDNERCIRCLRCFSKCPRSAIRWQILDKRNKENRHEEVSETAKKETTKNHHRRHFLKTSGVLVLGFSLGGMWTKFSKQKSTAVSDLKILPPGAGDIERFEQKCTACQLCVSNCPAKIIKPSLFLLAYVSLDLSDGFCDYHCNRCGEICPTDAILPLSILQKQRTKIAEAVFDAKNCIVFQEDEKCGKCARVCPTGAIRLRKSGAPYPVNENLCIGCGACQKICPAPKKAMSIIEIKKQILLNNENVN